MAGSMPDDQREHHRTVAAASNVPNEDPSIKNSDNNSRNTPWTRPTKVPAKVRVVSFDLDNTLWCTTSTIGAALNAVTGFLSQRDVKLAVRTEIVMKELFVAHKSTYAPLLGQHATCPSQLTQLRIDALCHILQTHHDYQHIAALEFATQAFDAMTQARHQAIPQYLAVGVVETLQQLRLRLGEDGSSVIMGAITDGNADPRRVETLRPYFDFVVQAESVGASKPDPRVFTQAVHDVLPQLDDSDDVSTVGPWWVHIGDDLVKDVAGAKQVGMRTIWCRELIQEKLHCPKKSALANDLSSWGNATSCQENAAIPPPQDQEDCADAVVDHFADIVDVLESWHKEGQRQQ